MYPRGKLDIFFGLDLGKDRNYTALAAIERRWYAADAMEFIRSGGQGYQGEFRYKVIALERCALGTPYPEVVEWLRRMVQRYAPHVTAVVVDATGGGNPMMDFFRKAGLGVTLIGLAIGTSTGGRTASGHELVARHELLTHLQIAVQSKKFMIDTKACREAEALSRELVLLRLEGKRAGVQDDLAFALALALWYGLR